MSAQSAYAAGADLGRDGKSWTSATLSQSYKDCDCGALKRAFLEGFEYGEYYRLGESAGYSQDPFNKGV